MLEATALEGLDGIGMSGGPAFLIAIHEGNITVGFEGIGCGRSSSFDKTEVFVLPVDGALRAVLFGKSDGEELALGGFDEVADGLRLCLHSAVSVDKRKLP